MIVAKCCWYVDMPRSVGSGNEYLGWCVAAVSYMRPADSHRKPRLLEGWRTVKELSEELRVALPRAWRAWLSSQGIQRVRRGRVSLVHGLDVDAALRKL